MGRLDEPMRTYAAELAKAVNDAAIEEGRQQMINELKFDLDLLKHHNGRWDQRSKLKRRHAKHLQAHSNVVEGAGRLVQRLEGITFEVRRALRRTGLRRPQPRRRKASPRLDPVRPGSEAKKGLSMSTDTMKPRSTVLRDDRRQPCSW